MQPRRPARGDRALHGEPGQFVAVDQTAPIPQQQPSLVQPPQGGQIDAERRQQSVVQPVRSRGRDLQHLEVGRGDAGGARQHRVPHGGGQGSVRLLGDLGDEERVAARHRVHRLGLQGSVGQQFSHAGHAQRSQPKGAEVLDRREVTEQRTGRVLSGDLVIAIGDDDGARHGLQSADQEPQHLDRCRVDPVQILDHQHRGLGAQGVVGRFAHLGERSVPIQRSEIGQEIAERAERPRRGQRVAGAAEHPQPGRLGAGHLDQRGLAGPRLATDRQSDAGAPEGAVQGPGQRVQLRVPLDEPHGLTVERSHRAPEVRSPSGQRERMPGRLSRSQASSDSRSAYALRRLVEASRRNRQDDPVGAGESDPAARPRTIRSRPRILRRRAFGPGAQRRRASAMIRQRRPGDLRPPRPRLGHADVGTERLRDE